MEKIAIHVFVKPNAKKTNCIGIINSVMQIALKARARDGEANEELCQFISEYFDIPKSHVFIYRGGKSRHKVIHVPKSGEIKNKLFFLLGQILQPGTSVPKHDIMKS